MLVTRKPKTTNEWTPEDYNFKAWAFDISIAANSTTPVSGTSVVVRLKLEKAITVDKAHFICTSSGSALANVFAALYQDGELVAQSENTNTAFQSSGGKTLEFSSPVTLKPGYVDVMLWQDGTTPANIARGTQLSGVGDFLTGQERRYATADIGLTDIAPSTLGTKSALAAAVWCALS